MSWHYDGEIRIKKLETQPYGTNCYIVFCSQSGEGVIVDTPGEASKILAQAEDIKVKYIIITHTHFDHLGSSRLRWPSILRKQEPFPHHLTCHWRMAMW